MVVELLSRYTDRNLEHVAIVLAFGTIIGKILSQNLKYQKVSEGILDKLSEVKSGRVSSLIFIMTFFFYETIFIMTQ
jgi:H+/gluconate symporter-like permease